MHRSIALVAGATLYLAACSGVPPVVESIVDAIPVIDDSAYHVYALALDGCQVRPDESDRLACIEQVKAAGKPMIDALQALRKAWCAASPESEGCGP